MTNVCFSFFEKKVHILLMNCFLVHLKRESERENFIKSAPHDITDIAPEIFSQMSHTQTQTHTHLIQFSK